MLEPFLLQLCTLLCFLSSSPLLLRDPLLLQALLFMPSLLLLRFLFGGSALFLLEPFLLPEVLLGRPDQLDALALLGTGGAAPLRPRPRLALAASLLPLPRRVEV